AAPRRARRHYLPPARAGLEVLDVLDGLGKRLGRLLRQVVFYSAGDRPMRVLAREFLGVRGGFRMRRPVGVALEGNGGYADVRARGQTLLQLLVLRLAIGQAQAPAIVVNDDGDMIRIVKSSGTALEGRLVEIPLRRGELPDEQRKVAPILVIALL